jgi:hypothetical protein
MTELTHASLPDFVRANRFAVIHFFAIWNDYDSQMRDILERKVPSDLRDLIAYGRFDVDLVEHQETCRQHKILNIPFLALYRDGSLTHTITGMRAPHEIVACLRQLVS